MERLTAKDFAPELLELYDFYVHGKLSRREFLDRAAAFTLCSMTAVAVLDALTPNYALAQQVAFTDPDIIAEYVSYPSPNGHGEVRAYLVRPARAEGKVPGIVVVHENRGLNPYIEDVARRVAKAGFVALAPDGLSSVGGYPGNDDKGRELQAAVDPQKLMNDFFAAIEWLMAHEATTEKIGITGSAMAVAWPMPPRWHTRNWRRQCRSMAVRPIRRMWRRFKHRCCSSSPNTTSASMKPGPPMKPRSRRPASTTRPTSTRAPSMAFTMTAPRATTSRRLSWPGNAPSPGSSVI